jgi:hypothetical protein
LEVKTSSYLNVIKSDLAVPRIKNEQVKLQHSNFAEEPARRELQTRRMHVSEMLPHAAGGM